MWLYVRENLGTL